MRKMHLWHKVCYPQNSTIPIIIFEEHTNCGNKPCFFRSENKKDSIP